MVFWSSSHCRLQVATGLLPSLALLPSFSLCLSPCLSLSLSLSLCLFFAFSSLFSQYLLSLFVFTLLPCTFLLFLFLLHFLVLKRSTQSAHVGSLAAVAEKPLLSNPSVLCQVFGLSQKGCCSRQCTKTCVLVVGYALRVCFGGVSEGKAKVTIIPRGRCGCILLDTNRNSHCSHLNLCKLIFTNCLLQLQLHCPFVGTETVTGILHHGMCLGILLDLALGSVAGCT